MTEDVRISTVPASRAFLESVAKGVIEKMQGDPLALADTTILVPDRDTVMALRRAFAKQNLEMGQGSGASAMPKIDAVGDFDIDTLSLKIADDRFLSQALMGMPPPVSHLERQLVLAGEILKIEGMASSVQKAVKLGGELGRLIDMLQRYGVDVKTAQTLVPPAFQKQWGKTEDFLKIITDAWPAYLEKRGAVDPEEHANAVLRVRALHWLQHPPEHHVIAVGFNEAPPALMHLLQTVVALPKGEIILQGFDRGIDEASWQALADGAAQTHPQAAFRMLLDGLGVEKSDVSEWATRVEKTDQARAVNPEAMNKARAALLREAMRPAATAEGWGEAGIDQQALNGMDLIICGSPQEEASVIALKLREVLEVQGRSAALVTADRGLARRVAARLKHWQIDVEDGAGIPLAAAPAGVFLFSTAHMAAENWTPISFLQAMKHPLTAMGQDPAAFKKKLAVLEDSVFHGPRPAEGAEGVKGALETVFNRSARKRTDKTAQQDKADLDALIADIENAGADFFAKMTATEPQSFADLFKAHILFCEALATDHETPGAARLWRGADGVRASKFLARLLKAAEHMPPMTGRDYADVLGGLMRDVSVRPAPSSHPVIKILTPAQAMRDKSDIVILGGLNDEVWPARSDDSPWFSPDMMQGLGLPRPDKKTGLQAHQFTQLLSSPNVMMTRAVRSGDAPTVPSPFLTRLQLVLKGAGLENILGAKTQLLDIHIAMHTPQDVTPIAAPAPTPIKSLRPKELPVTAIEGLMRDPYSVYAKYVLKIKPKASIDASPGAAQRGIFTHAALDAFVRKYPDKLPDNAYEELLKIGEDTFRTHLNNPTVRAFWWPRFERVAQWFVRFETERREMSRTLGTEVRGKLEIDLGDDVFTLTAIADRVDMGPHDQMEIIDYKTGSVPTQKSVALGFAPQLTLEALIAFTGGFKGIDAGDIGELQYWKLSGGRPAAEVVNVKGDVRHLVDNAREGITELMKTFNNSKTPYLSTPRPEHAPRYNNYEHLSRVGEWSKVKKIVVTKEATKKPTRKKTTKKAHAKSAAPKKKK